MQLYIVRHGQSSGNIRNKSCNSANEARDPHLTETGKDQVRLLGERFSGERLTAVFSSPLVRAVDTARAILTRQPSGGANTLCLLPEMMEVDTEPGYGGIGIEALKTEFPDIGITMANFAGADCLTKEEKAETLARAYRIIDFIKATFTADEKVLLSSHGTFNHFLVAAALGLGTELKFNFCQENTGVTKVNYFDNTGRIRLSYMDDLSHLYRDYPNLQFEL